MLSLVDHPLSAIPPLVVMHFEDTLIKIVYTLLVTQGKITTKDKTHGI